MSTLRLSTKPDLEEAVLRWRHFWNGELYERPVVVMSVPKSGIKPEEVVSAHEYRYYHAVKKLWDKQLELIDRWMAQTAFMGDMIPMFSPDFGPDQWAAFFGAQYHFNDGALYTNWVEPIIQDWDRALPLRLETSNRAFQDLLSYANRLAAHGEGRYVVGQIDAHSNADALSALRGPERFLMDILDAPDTIAQAMRDVRASYKPVHEAIARAGRMGAERGYGHYGLWHERPFQVVQSDVICMLGPEPFRKFVLPALEEEFACYNGAYFHLDGPGALKHLDDILKIPGRWILQWQPGDGQKPNWQWGDILKKAQGAGKAVHVFGAGLNLAAVQQLHRELNPARVVYSPAVSTEAEGLAILDWLKQST